MRCTAKKKSGWQCPQRAIEGSDKCRYHGGKSRKEKPSIFEDLQRQPVGGKLSASL